MTFTLWACQTTTGQNLGRLDGTPTQWQRAVNSLETAEASISSGALDPDVFGGSTEKRDTHRRLTTPWLMSLVIDWDGTVVWAGPINARPQDADLTLNAVGLKSLLTRRKILSQTGPYASQQQVYAGISPTSIARALVVQATDPSKPGAPLPIVLPGTETDSDTSHNRTYRGFEPHTVSDALDELTTAGNGGPDIDFAPEWVDNARTAIRWVMRSGTLAAPKLQGPTVFTFDATQPGASVQRIAVTEDASALATAQWGVGGGTGSGSLMSFASSTALTSQGWPLLEQQTDYTTTQLQAILDGQVAGDLAANGAPIVQWALDVNAAGTPLLGTYRPGDAVRVNVRGHWWVPDGEYGMRVLGYSGSGANTVSLQLQASALRGATVLGTVDSSIIGRLARLERST